MNTFLCKIYKINYLNSFKGKYMQASMVWLRKEKERQYKILSICLSQEGRYKKIQIRIEALENFQK